MPWPIVPVPSTANFMAGYIAPMETRERVLVTGASKGIGAACAEMFAATGFDVVVHFKDDEAGARDVLGRVEARGAKGAIVRADLSKWSEGERLVAESGDLDHVV